MAIQTKSLGLLVEPEGNAELQIDWDDATLLLRAVRVINDHPTRTARVAAQRIDGSRRVTRDAPPNQTTTQNIPTTQANRLQLTVTPEGRLDGVSYEFGWA
jgi:hypothetical protein